MINMNKIAILFILFILVLSTSCVNEEVNKQEEYEKCTSVCASVLEEDFVTMELCRRECEEEFLKEE